MTARNLIVKDDLTTGPSLAQKVAFLSRAEAYGAPGGVARRETHMSWLFFPDDAVYKLKKPVRFPYLDFSTLERREAACQAEFCLNLKLAPSVYRGVVPLVATPDGLALGGEGRTVDWLVVMRRFDEARTLESLLRAGKVKGADLDRLAAVLGDFYRHARPVHVGAAGHAAQWRTLLAYNRRILLRPELGLPAGVVRRIDAIQRRFLRRCGDLLRRRVTRGRVVEGHGDLRPEHIWLGQPLSIIDRLEFNALLRIVDPFDEIAFLDLECERLGAPWAGRRLRGRIETALHDRPPEALYLFYRSSRAMLRARLAIAHLLEPTPRTPEKWPAQARAYLALAARDARRLARLR